MKIFTSIDQLIGHTPILELTRFEKHFELKNRLFAKIEFFNPAGSVKDRVALSMINQAEQCGKLNKDTTIIEPTSGNTGIGLACVAASRGYKVIIVMPDTMSKERQLLMKAYGAELVLSDGTKGMTGAIEKAKELSESIENSFIAGQFSNSANPFAHYNSTGPELWNDTEGKIDAFVCGVGTGGTITGTARFLKEKNPAIKIFAVEPETSAVLSGQKAGKHGLQGIGAGFVPEILDKSVIDEIITVSDKNAFETARFLGTKEGVLVGISSGAALFASIQVAKRSDFCDKNIAVLLPDTGERYLSTNLFSD